jgi:hypothetical protein
MNSNAEVKNLRSDDKIIDEILRIVKASKLGQDNEAARVIGGKVIYHLENQAKEYLRGVNQNDLIARTKSILSTILGRAEWAHRHSDAVLMGEEDIEQQQEALLAGLRAACDAASQVNEAAANVEQQNRVVNSILAIFENTIIQTLAGPAGGKRRRRASRRTKRKTRKARHSRKH